MNNSEQLQGIKVQSGYWLCYHSWHDDMWVLTNYGSRAWVKVAYKRQYIRCFRHHDWFWIVKVDG